MLLILRGRKCGDSGSFPEWESFADECGLDRTYMGGIERGERNVALRNIGKIAEALGISIAELMRDI